MRSLPLIQSAFLGLFLFKAAAFPIDPVPLRSMIEKSDLIVYGKVTDIEGDHTKQIKRLERSLANSNPELRSIVQDQIASAKRFGPMSGEATAKVSVLNVYKGKIRDEISIDYDAGLVCPSPPRFQLGSNVFLFLKRTGLGKFETYALSNGLIEADRKHADFLGERVAEYQDILREIDSNKKADRTVDWLVKLVEHSETRWDGIAELVERTSILGKRIPAAFAGKLTPAQLARMKVAVFASSGLAAGDREVLRLVAKSDPAPVARHVINYLRRAELPGPIDRTGDDAFENSWDIYDALFFLAELAGDSKRFTEDMKGTSRTDFMHGAQTRVRLTQKFLPKAMRELPKKQWWTEQSSGL